MGKAPLFFLLSRSGNEWLVEDEKYIANFKASVGENPLIPPTTGWNFRNFDIKEYEEDPQLRCSSTPSSSFCSVTVSLKGWAKELQGECEGDYKDTGLRSVGRKVIKMFNMLILCSLRFTFRCSDWRALLTSATSL